MYELLILGALLVHERTGYKLREILGNMLEPRRRVSNSVIYPVLHKMAQAGYISLREVAESGRKQKVASILPAGERHFAQLMAAPVPLDAKREETYRFKLRNLYRVSPELQRRILLAYRRACQDDMTVYAKVDGHLMQNNQRRADAPWAHRVFQLQRSLCHSKIDWVDAQLAIINQGKESNDAKENK